VSCVTMPIAASRLSCVAWPMSWPSMRIEPCSTSWKRSSRLTKER